jgi:hypothetical protein
MTMYNMVNNQPYMTIMSYLAKNKPDRIMYNMANNQPNNTTRKHGKNNLLVMYNMVDNRPNETMDNMEGK